LIWNVHRRFEIICMLVSKSAVDKAKLIVFYCLHYIVIKTTLLYSAWNIAHGGENWWKCSSRTVTKNLIKQQRDWTRTFFSSYSTAILSLASGSRDPLLTQPSLSTASTSCVPRHKSISSQAKFMHCSTKLRYSFYDQQIHQASLPSQWRIETSKNGLPGEGLVWLTGRWYRGMSVACTAGPIVRWRGQWMAA